MTSYANETTTGTNTTAATTTGNATAAAAAEVTNVAIDGNGTAGAGNASAAIESSSKVMAKQLATNSNSYHHHHHNDDDNSSSDGREKTDHTPENIKKIAEIMGEDVVGATAAAAAATSPSTNLSPRHNLQHHHHHQHTPQNNANFVGLGAAIDESNAKFCLGKPPPLPAEKVARANHHHQQQQQQQQQQQNNHQTDVDEEDNSTESNSTSTATKQSLAFTIDHFDTSANDAAAQAARYKNMMERFQNRHKRGASMSKLESDGPVTPNGGADELATRTPSSELMPPPQVKMRVRERSASRVRDASKRHSWSPRSSGTSETTASAMASRPATAVTKSKVSPSPATAKGAANSMANRTGQFTPRSTAMQLALRQVEMLCPQPPLADGKTQIDEDVVSEAGTYTLDGDNYTEEQKDLMNIDRNAAAAAAAAAAGKQRPKQLPVKAARASNVLEVNYYHETQPQQESKASKAGSTSNSSTTGAYLEQLKSRVMRQSCPPPPRSPPSPAADVGCFTSVTTSGVLAKQRALDTHPKLTRHSHSLSTSQIDSSEYVSNEAKLRQAPGGALAGSATDCQKAEYRLNVFTTSTSQQQHQMPETPTTPTATEAALLQTVQTKQDWIQEWARNARARSLAQDVSGSAASRRKQQQAQQLMTRSYNCSDTGVDSLTDDSLSLYHHQHQHLQQQQQQQQHRQYVTAAAAGKLNRSNLAERYRLLGDCDYASDPALCSHNNDGGSSGSQMIEPPYKPPKSPSKIPSPLHTLGRARSASRPRPHTTDAYLEQTAAAISCLQQSLSRRSSVKSPAQSSPQHSLETASGAGGGGGGGGGYRRSPLHRALMTSSINEAQLQLLTSGDYLQKQMNRRKNSLDDDIEPLETSAPLSPLRRSSSFQQQQQMQHQQHSSHHQHHHNHHHHSGRQGRPNFQNLYTPPAARHAQQQQQQLLQQLKKSSSSNNFEQAYSDYDNELQYYINDEDELGTGGAYYSSNEEDEPPDMREPQETTTVPLSNTRLNKALLMRIERSKQRQQQQQQNSHTPAKPSSAPAGKLSAAAAAAGLIACPNTPELPRRGIKSATARTTAGSMKPSRQSMPRDTSLSRLAQQVPSSLANAKKQLLQTANASNREQQQRVQPKYLDISKYKSAQSNNFLRKNDAKSTLKPSEQMKRSPSASSMGLSRGEGIRASNRSVRSAASGMNSSTISVGSGGGGGGGGVGGGMGGGLGQRASSSVRRDASVNKQKEAELAMWKRRSTYDPMKAAAEDRRKKEEARRAQSQARQQQQQQQQQQHLDDEVPFESVLRPANNLTLTGSSSIHYSPRNSMENDAWTLGESSEFGDDYDENDEIDNRHHLHDDDDDEDIDLDECCENDNYHDNVAGGQESDDVFEVESVEGTPQIAK
ncbi:LOW QUALITY PROTEIN: streptococcal hemagglutinin [Drosophila tropicalis]|uniref:LOW QUALITY PROTEIN: streptococcal hemagglutinin n=1 Tax=Drosophila tropicalis TaxID=46794 RepID=UPI0035ABA80D